ncbi:MAG: protoporphyrinogen oxidase [Candidatus Bipolaricaulia bacterium]
MSGIAKKVAIVGCGISGLATAYFLREQARETGAAVDCVLIESSSRLGGKIFSERIGHFIIEGGPDSFLTLKPWALELCERLGLSDRLLGPNPKQRKTYVLHKGRLWELPEGTMPPTRIMPLLSSGLISPWGKLRMALDLVIPPKRDEHDEPLAAFLRRRLGREALERLAEPLLAGIYAGDAERLSLQATFPQLRELELKHGSLIAGMLARKREAIKAPPAGAGGANQAMFMTLRGGLGELVNTLVSRLEGVSFLMSRRVIALKRTGSSWALQLEDGTILQTDAVVLATPAYVTAELLEQLNPQAAKILQAIPYVSTATVSLAFKRADVEHPLDGYGFVVPRTEGRKITACTWTSSKWPSHAPADHVLMRCYLGRAGDEDAVQLDDEALLETVLQELGALLSVTAEPVLVRIYRWERSMPQYLVGHLERLAALERALAEQPGVILTGAAYRGIGLPDCIYQGALAASKVFRFLAEG